jgi:predicted ester cyclase
VRGIEARKHIHAVYLTALPDLCDTVEDMFAEGDKVAVRLTSRGTHRGELQGIPPTGKQVTVPGMTINRVADGKITEEWVIVDALDTAPVKRDHAATAAGRGLGGRPRRLGET